MAAAKERLNQCIAICESHGESRVRAEALWYLALLTRQQGDLAGAKGLAAEALRHMRALAHHLLIANCLEVLAWISADESRHQRAARLLGAAGALRDAHGVQLLPSLARSHDQCESQVRRALGSREYDKATREGTLDGLDEVIARALGERAESTTRQADQDEVLTRREREVADLLAQGLSNRDIAASLVISPRTAETHVEHILNKLGFTSRSQVAAWVAERRAATPDQHS